MKKLFCLFIVSLILRGEDFISQLEYGQMLYQDPRGVSCVPCHGEKGEGGELATYAKKVGKKRVVVNLNAPNIQNSSFEKFKEAILKGKGVMPKYFLTTKEIKAIYKYIKKCQKEPKRDKEGDLF